MFSSSGGDDSSKSSAANLSSASVWSEDTIFSGSQGRLKHFEAAGAAIQKGTFSMANIRIIREK